MNRTILGLSVLFLGGCVVAAEPTAIAPELGRITFQRNFAAAVTKAKADTKPLFVLFDEVPG